jgi:hypothetical protein
MIQEMQEKPSESMKGDEAIIAELQERMAVYESSSEGMRKEALDDLEFLKGDQWPEVQRRQREMAGRPCLTINTLPTYLQQVTNDQRQNRASIKVSPTNENATKKTAEVIQGMIRHIEYDSSADIAYDTAVNSAAAIGFGYFRLTTEYERPDSFDQVIKIKRIRNSFAVGFDPNSVEPDGSDAQWVTVSGRIRRNEFRIRYPKAVATLEKFDYDRSGAASAWLDSDSVRIAEYYRIEQEKHKLYQFVDGTTSYDKNDATPINPVHRDRDVLKKKVMWYLCTPFEVLERAEIMCDWIPVFPVFGTEIDIDGKVYRAGMIRNAKDPAMMYNFWMTSATEEVAMRPKIPYIGAEGQFEGHEKEWARANTSSMAYLEYKPTSVDGQLAPPPTRQPMIDVPVGVLTMAGHARDNIKATTGLFDSSLGAAGTATSGKQEIAQQRQGNVANFHYMDNFTRTLRHAGKCIINMIPHYYDTQRLVRTRAEDGLPSTTWINKIEAAANEVMNDVRIGYYDAAVTTGPSHATMRAEAADAMVQFGQSWPKLMDIAGDKVVQAMNWPGAEDIAERIARTIPPEIKNDPADNPQGPQIPPEVQQQMQQMQATIEELQKAADVNHAKVTAEEIKKEAGIEIAKIRAESANDVAELTGMVKLLVERMQPPPELAAAVNEDLTEGESEEGEVYTPVPADMNSQSAN